METRLVAALVIVTSLLLICLLQVSASTSSILTLSGPPRPVAVGDGADYVCTQNNINGDIQWIINNMPLEDLNLPNVQTTSLTGRGFLLFNDLSVNFNETTVQCEINNSGTIINSNIIKLLVQGPPSAVGSLSPTTLNPYTISLTWTPSFTLNIPNPDITYCVSVEVNITASSSVTRSECGITTNAYNYTINPNEGCGFYRFTVTPMNRLGNGSAVIRTHPMESSVLSEGRLVPVSIVGEVYTYRIVLSAPACVSGLNFVDHDTGERMNKSLITGNAIITFTTEELTRNRYYNVTVNAINVESSATAIISTHGIENTTYLMEGNGTCVETDYFRNSTAIGALYIFICVDSHGAMNFSYQAFDRDRSPEHIPLVPYLVLAYDIESDGALYDGDSFPASVMNLFNPEIPHRALQQIPDFITCTVTTTDRVISARCDNLDHNVTGFQMIVQNTNITDLTLIKRLMIKRTNDTSSLMNLRVEVSGEHLITIYSIRRGRGIVYTYTPYQMRMMVDVPVTTSALSSTHPTSTSIKSGVKILAVVVPVVVVVVLVVIIMLILGGIYAYFKKKHCLKHCFKVKSEVCNVYDPGYDMRLSNSTHPSPLSEPVSINGVEGNHVSPSDSESSAHPSPLSVTSDPLLQHPSGGEDREPVPCGGVEGNYVETLMSGSSVGTPITTGRSEYGEIIGEYNKQGQFYERVQVEPATINKDEAIDFHDVNYAIIDHTKHNTTIKADQQNTATKTAPTD